MRLKLHRFDLELKHTFTISRGSIDVQSTLIAELEHDGQRGFGEATGNTYYGFTVEAMAEALRSVQPQIEAWSGEDPETLWEQLREPLASNPFALCAVDQAAHDLWGKRNGKPVYEMWDLQMQGAPQSDYTIGIDSIDKMLEKLREQPDWPIYKIKLGSDNDLEIVRSLREATNAVFRVDANCGWTEQQCLEIAPALKELGVEFIEQPLPADYMEAMRRLHGQSALPLVADESCIVESDVAACQGAFHGVNVKLVKCGGLTPARRMLRQARELGMKTMVGCMTESSVGISAIAQLLPLLDYVDMDGAVLLREDIADGVVVSPNGCQFPQVNGCGVTLRKDALI